MEYEVMRKLATRGCVVDVPATAVGVTFLKTANIDILEVVWLQEKR